MDFPFLLIALVALPLAVAGVIVVVSAARRGRDAPPDGAAPEPRHRGQADSAAVQTATERPPVAGRQVQSGRDRRARSTEAPKDT